MEDILYGTDLNGSYIRISAVPVLKCDVTCFLLALCSGGSFSQHCKLLLFSRGWCSAICRIRTFYRLFRCVAGTVILLFKERFEFNMFCNDGDLATVLAFFSFPAFLFEPAYNAYATALRTPLRTCICKVSKCLHIEVRHLLCFFSLVRLIATVHCDRNGAYMSSLCQFFFLRLADNIA